MYSIYILEFVGTTTLGFLLGLLGKGYGHILVGSTLLLTGTMFADNCFNPAIALCYLLTNKIELPTFMYYVVIEFFAAVLGFLTGTHLSKYYK